MSAFSRRKASLYIAMFLAQPKHQASGKLEVAKKSGNHHNYLSLMSDVEVEWNVVAEGIRSSDPFN